MYLATFLPLVCGVSIDIVEPQRQAFRRLREDLSSPKVAADAFSCGLVAVLTKETCHIHIQESDVY